MTNLHLILAGVLIVVSGLYALFELSTMKSISSLKEVDANQNLKLFSQQEAFKSSMRREVRKNHVLQCVLAIIATIAFAMMGSVYSTYAAMITACLAAWHFDQYRTDKITEIEMRGVPR